MGKYILGGLFVLLLALNVGLYVYFVNEIDGSTIKHTRETAPRLASPGDQPKR
jgi:hypothetical protein